jgi:vancomycin aglycone glucosyltransferase
MRVLLSTYGSRADVEPLVGLAVRLRALGAEVRVCAPPDCAERLAEVCTIRTDGATVAATLLLDRS